MKEVRPSDAPFDVMQIGRGSRRMKGRSTPVGLMTVGSPLTLNRTSTPWKFAVACGSVRSKQLGLTDLKRAADGEATNRAKRAINKARSGAISGNLRQAPNVRNGSKTDTRG